MTNLKVARKYNIALIQTAKELGLEENLKKDFIDIKNSIKSSRELSNFLTTPVIASEKKAEIIKALFNGKVNELTLKFLEFLCIKNRINILEIILDDFFKLMNEMHGIVDANIKTAIELNDEEKKQLTEKLKQFTGKKINAVYNIDKSIKGGFVAKIDDKIIDASIARQLELLRERFAKGSFNN